MKTIPPPVPEKGEYDCVIDRVVDGDTFDICLLVGLRVRLNGVQVAEHNTDKGKLVIQKLTDRLSKQLATVTLHGREKYGRMLASVRMNDGKDVVEWLIAQGLAVPWDGKGPRPYGMDAPEVCGGCEPEDEEC